MSHSHAYYSRYCSLLFITPVTNGNGRCLSLLRYSLLGVTKSSNERRTSQADVRWSGKVRRKTASSSTVKEASNQNKRIP